MDLSVLHVFESEEIESCHVFVVEYVEDLPPGFAVPHKFHVTQSAQLMRDRRFGHPEGFRDLAHAVLSFEQKGNDAQAGWVAEGREQVGEVKGG